MIWLNPLKKMLNYRQTHVFLYVKTQVLLFILLEYTLTGMITSLFSVKGKRNFKLGIKQEKFTENLLI